MRLAPLKLPLLAVALLTQIAVAQACLVLPPPPREAGESEEGYRARLKAIEDQQLLESQQYSWDHATSVALVRVDRIEPFRSGAFSGRTGAYVTTARWLKGGGGRLNFKFRPIGWCFGEGAVAEGKPGETFVIFFSGARHSRKAIGNGWRSDLIRDRRILASPAG